jgi:hypothetical protein
MQTAEDEIRDIIPRLRAGFPGLVDELRRESALLQKVLHEGPRLKKLLKEMEKSKITPSPELKGETEDEFRRYHKAYHAHEVESKGIERKNEEKRELVREIRKDVMQLTLHRHQIDMILGRVPWLGNFFDRVYETGRKDRDAFISMGKADKGIIGFILDHYYERPQNTTKSGIKGSTKTGASPSISAKHDKVINMESRLGTLQGESAYRHSLLRGVKDRDRFAGLPLGMLEKTVEASEKESDYQGVHRMGTDLEDFINYRNANSLYGLKRIVREGNFSWISSEEAARDLVRLAMKNGIMIGRYDRNVAPESMKEAMVREYCTDYGRSLKDISRSLAERYSMKVSESTIRNYARKVLGAGISRRDRSAKMAYENFRKN